MEGILLTLAVLACPVAMGLMMLFMRKGMRGRDEDAQEAAGGPSVDDLRAEQRQIAEEIGRLEAGEREADGRLANR